MDPITTLTYILTSFYGYYIGSDFYNYFKIRSNFEQVNNHLHSIETNLNRLLDKQHQLDRVKN